MSNTVIENYEPSDEGWGVVVGRLAQPPAEVDDSSPPTVDQPPAEEDQPAGS